MTVDSRKSAPHLLRSAEEALSGPRRYGVGLVPGMAFTRPGTLEGLNGHQFGAGPSPACAGYGAQAASAGICVNPVQPNRASRQAPDSTLKTDVLGKWPWHSAIAICTARVLNSMRAPTASLTGQLTRHERRPNRARQRTKTRYGTQGRQRDYALEDTHVDQTRGSVFHTQFNGVRGRVGFRFRADCRIGPGRFRGYWRVDRCGHSRWRPFPARGRLHTALASRSGGAYRAQLCRTSPSRRAALS